MKTPGTLRPPGLPWLDKVKFITSWWWMGCEPEDKWLYLEFSKAPAGRIALLLITPDLEEIVQEWWKPKGLRNQRHGRKGQRGVANLSRFFDVDQQIADLLPDCEELAYIRYGSAAAWTLKLIDIADRVSWNIAVVEMSTDLVFETLWGIISTDNSNCPHFGRLRRHNDYGSYLNTGMGVGPLACGPVVFEVGDISSTVFSATVGHGWWTCALSGNFRLQDIGTGQMELAITDYDEGAKVIASSGLTTLNQQDWSHATIGTTVIGPGTIGFGYRSNRLIEGTGVEAVVFGGKYLR